MNKYSIGLPLKLKERFLKSFFKRNKNNIYDVYFSLIDDIKFTSRSCIYSKNKNEKKKLIRILRYLNRININLELVMNSFYYFKEEDFEKAKLFLEKNKIKIKTICILEKDKRICDIHFNVEKCFSYNNNLKKQTSLEKFDGFKEVVIGNVNLRNISLCKDLNSLDKKIKVLLNNGCTHGCSWCVVEKEKYSSENCFNSWKKQVDAFGEVEVFSKTSVFPFEQFFYKQFISNKSLIFKISCRSFHKQEAFEKVFNYYKNNINFIEPFYYYLFSILKFYKTENYDVKEIIEFKKKIWEEEMHNYEHNNKTRN